MTTTRTDIGSDAWWTDPTWPKSGTTAVRRQWVRTKLAMLDMAKMGSLCASTFPQGTLVQPPPKFVGWENVTRKQWVIILRGMGATDDEVRQIMERLGFGWLHYLG